MVLNKEIAAKLAEFQQIAKDFRELTVTIADKWGTIYDYKDLDRDERTRLVSLNELRAQYLRWETDLRPKFEELARLFMVGDCKVESDEVKTALEPMANITNIDSAKERAQKWSKLEGRLLARSMKKLNTKIGNIADHAKPQAILLNQLIDAVQAVIDDGKGMAEILDSDFSSMILHYGKGKIDKNVVSYITARHSEEIFDKIQKEFDKQIDKFLPPTMNLVYTQINEYRDQLLEFMLRWKDYTSQYSELVKLSKNWGIKEVPQIDFRDILVHIEQLDAFLALVEKKLYPLCENYRYYATKNEDRTRKEMWERLNQIPDKWDKLREKESKWIVSSQSGVAKDIRDLNKALLKLGTELLKG